jgi:DNA invertase Pin-like site-specific DNA recombinase
MTARLRWTIPANADFLRIVEWIKTHNPQAAARVGRRILDAVEDLAALSTGYVVIIPAVDRLARYTTDLLVLARKMQRAGAGIRSLAEPFLDTTSDFAEIVFAILDVAEKLERRRILERTARGRADAKGKGGKFGRKPKRTPHQQCEARA